MKKLLTQISVVWCTDDVIQTAKEKGIELTEEQISDVLSLMQSEHDATIGINWDVIDYHIDTVLAR